MSWETPRVYFSDDRDIEDNRLRIFMGGNFDWYVSVVKAGDRFGPAVRITTHGTPRGLEEVPRLISQLYQKLPEEPPMTRGPIHPDYRAMSSSELWKRIREEAHHVRTVMTCGEVDQALSVIRHCKAELNSRGEWKAGRIVG